MTTSKDCALKSSEKLLQPQQSLSRSEVQLLCTGCSRWQWRAWKAVSTPWHKEQSYKALWMNDLPVIGYLCLRKELWDRQGANTASRYKELYGEKLFRRPKKQFWGKINAFFAIVLSKKNMGSVWYVENVSFCLNHPEICDKTYR